jgi:hypothetical protein
LVRVPNSIGVKNNVMRERDERIHIRARKATKLHWAMICKATGYKKQSDAFEHLMVELLNKGQEILNGVNEKRIYDENFDWDEWLEQVGDGRECED